VGGATGSTSGWLPSGAVAICLCDAPTSSPTTALAATAGVTSIDGQSGALHVTGNIALASGTFHAQRHGSTGSAVLGHRGERRGRMSRPACWAQPGILRRHAVTDRRRRGEHRRAPVWSIPRGPTSPPQRWQARSPFQRWHPVPHRRRADGQQGRSERLCRIWTRAAACRWRKLPAALSEAIFFAGGWNAKYRDHVGSPPC